MSKYFSIDRGDKPYAVVKGGNDNGTVVYLNNVDDEDGIAHGETNAIEIDDGRFELLPSRKNRDCIVVAGKSGSGKSFWSRMFAKNYLKLHPKNEVILFSPEEIEDEAFTDLPITKYIIDEDLLENPVSIDELQDCLVIFDDTDHLSNNKLTKMMIELQDQVLQIGRHKNISTIITVHMINNYRRSRILINEAHYIVLFLNGHRSHQTKYFLSKHQSLSNRAIKKLYELKSRWICFSNSAPQPVLSERECFVPDMNDFE